MTMQELVLGTDLFLFDLDGTLYLGENVFPFTADLLDALKKTGKTYRFLTNNSSKSHRDYVKKMTRLGIRSCEEDFITSGTATLYHIKETLPDAKLYLCATRSLKEQFRESGLTVTEDGAEADAIVLGCDTELTFEKIDTVCRELSRRDLPYFATHPDLFCPSEYGVFPDCGALANLIAESIHRLPKSIGKPSAAMPELAMKLTGIPRERTVIIGDRFATDIESGFAAGIKTLFVLSGGDTEEDLRKAPRKPDVVAASCEDLLAALRAMLNLNGI